MIEKKAAMAARLDPLRDDGVDAALFKPQGLGDGRGAAENFCSGGPRPRKSPSDGSPKWKLTTLGRHSSTRAQKSAS